MRRTQMQMVIYLDDLLIMRESLEEILLRKGTVIFALQNFGFKINKEKSYLKPKKVYYKLKIDGHLSIPRERGKKSIARNS